MNDERDWRTSKAPQWVKDAAQAEIDSWRLTAALAWPTETKPEPLPFRWVEYDRLIGEPQPGRYYAVHAASRVEAFDLARLQDLSDTEAAALRGQKWKVWAFRASVGGGWSTHVQRGPLFATEHDAKLYRRWMLCEDFAAKLLEAAK